MAKAEQFAFFKIPKLLFSAPEFKDIFIGAKLLYGLMLDRISLSVKMVGLTKMAEPMFILR